MAVLVSAHQLTHSFAARALFDNITFSVESGERIGLIGPNGAGKSTLLRIIAGQMQPDSGTLSLQRGLKVGFLEQVPQFASGKSVHATALEGAADPDDWEAQASAMEVMSHLSLADRGEESVAKLSGGWKKRVALARELVRKPDLLLLDEPTNHLDIESILWLEKFLARAQFATLTITHDRLFLQRVANRILELDRRNPNGLLSVNGSYADYLESKEQMLLSQEKRADVLQNTLRRETEWLRRGAKARTTKQQARINRHGELSAESEELNSRRQNRTARLDFQGTERSPKKLIEAKGIAKSLGGRKLFHDISVLLTPGRKIGLLGPNGCGKSTLIRALTGEIEPDEGTVFRSDQLQVAYFEQNRESLDPKATVMKTVCPTGDHVNFRGGRIHVRSYLDRFLFPHAQMEMSVSKLSGGEQSRLLLAKLMLQPANVLVLDEPTNDLDAPTLNVLAECLQEFDGAVILVTHDRYFLDQVADQVLAFVGGGELISFADLSQWETWREENKDRPVPTAVQPQGASAATTASSKKGRLGFKEQREYEGMEKTIHEAETLLKSLETESLLPELVSNAPRLAELSKEMGELQSRIESLYARWAELEAKL